jgi:glycosyl transferase family 87/WD40 repeat protein
VTRLLAWAVSALFLATTFRAGWTRAETDFPNYYTAAVLVRKGAPLHKYYDWTWFQRQMNYAGIENQLGGYIPQTPLTMLPMLGIAQWRVQTAKRIWLVLNLGFLAATFWLLSQVTTFSMAQVALLAFLGYGTLHANFLLGQYYVFLLFLLTLAFYCLKQERLRCSGLLFGTAFALKLYGGPFLLYFVVKRRWRAAAAMVATVAILLAMAVAMFGWGDIVYFARHILPRALEGETLDPYNSGNGTLSTLLRRSFVMEPELNPHPLWNAPGLFFFLQPFLTLTILVLPLFALRRSTWLNRDFALFFVVLIFASPNTASYTFILLLLPLVLLLEEASMKQRVLLISCYILLTLPMAPWWKWLFPKVWLLILLLVIAAAPYWRLVKPQHAALAVIFIAVIAGLAARRHLASYHEEPGRRWERVAVQRGAIYSSSPAVVRSGIVYQSIGAMHYVLRWFHAGRIDEFPFAGEAFHPTAQSPDGPIQFELVAHGSSRSMLLDLSTKKVTPAPPSAKSDAALSCVSPNGKWIVFTSNSKGSQQIFLRRANPGSPLQLTGGNCNSSSPAWELDSKAIVFASDCGRGIGLPALYRAKLDQLENAR